MTAQPIQGLYSILLIYVFPFIISSPHHFYVPLQKGQYDFENTTTSFDSISDLTNSSTLSMFNDVTVRAPRRPAPTYGPPTVKAATDPTAAATNVTPAIVNAVGLILMVTIVFFWLVFVLGTY
jgi:hypothetical protein